MKNKTFLSEKCACDSGKAFETCCSPYLQNVKIAPDAESLMRSRYTAYTRCDVNYLLLTWHSSTRPENLAFEEKDAPKWLWLNVERYYQDAVDPNKSVVEFMAAYKINGKAYRLHETSRFCKENGRWYYIDGDIQ